MKYRSFRILLKEDIFYVFSDRASYYSLFQITNLMHNSFILQQYVCYITILNMFRAVTCSFSGGTNCIVTASGIVTLCKQPYSIPVESGLQSALNRYTVGCLQRVTIPEAVTIQFVPPEDEQVTARNMLRIVM